MIKKEPYDSPEFAVLNFGFNENVNTTIDVINASNDVYEDDPFDI